MSAGICIMNKNAIALAADSAVTIGQHLAIHNSANKLFAISKTAPVGVIIYANAELMNIPMEIMIKQYKISLGTKSFKTLRDYVDSFLTFLTTNSTLFHFEQNEYSYILQVYSDLLSGMFGDYHRLVEAKIDELKRQLTDDELLALQHQAVDATMTYVKNLNSIPNYHVSDYVKEKYSSNISEFIKKEFNWVPTERIPELCNTVCDVFDKLFFRNGYMGLSFAGYGDDEIFPNMIHLYVSGIINSQIRYVEKEHLIITEDQPACITPLAQTDVIETFLFGISDSFLRDIGHELTCQIDQSISSMDNGFFTDGKKEEVQKVLNDTTRHILEQIIAKAQQEYLFPITQSIATLPIEELSLLAESMINITSVRRRVAIDNNIGTVGGPIDVAIISKSDGFIWLKRKHYFDGRFNPQYYYSHYILPGGYANGVSE